MGANRTDQAPGSDLHYLEEFAAKFGCAVHVYELMTNHVHLLLTPARPDSAALLMKNLGQRYVQYINRTYKRSGTLWEGRFNNGFNNGDRSIYPPRLEIASGDWRVR